MKKTIIIILLVFMTSSSYSQNKFGVFGGMNRTHLSSGFLKKTDNMYKSFGIHLGGLYDLKLIEDISFRPKLVFSQQGYRIDYSTNTEVKPTYLNLLFNFKFFKKTYLLVGPQIGYVLNKKKLLQVFPYNDYFDFGINFGTGREFNEMFLEFNIYRGFKSPFTDIYSKGAENTVFQFSVGYNFE